MGLQKCWVFQSRNYIGIEKSFATDWTAPSRCSSLPRSLTRWSRRSNEEDEIIPIPVEDRLSLNMAVVWRKDDYLTKEANSFISFCRKTFEAS